MKDMFQKSWISQLSILVACCLFLPILATAGIIDGDVINAAAETNYLSRQIPAAALGEGVGSISGTVTGSGSSFVPGVKVYAIDIDSNNPDDWKFDVTDENGDYSIDSLPTDKEYTVLFLPPEHSGFASEWYDNLSTGGNAKRVNLTTAIPVQSNIDAVLEESGNISGRVTDSEGAPIEGARVDAYVIENPDPATGGWLGGIVTEADGSYTLGELRTDVSFKVEFFETYINKYRGGLTEWYDNKPDINSAVPVTTGATVDAVLGDVLDPPSSSFNWLLFLPTIIINTTKLP